MRRPRSLFAATAALALVLAGCGSTGDASTSGGGSGGDGPSVKILKPADGDTIGVPFTLAVDSSEELGTTESGNHHVHIYFDGDDTAYEVIESGNGEDHEITADSPALRGLEPGEHELDISLRNADHSPAGADTKITVTIDTTGSGGSSGGGDNGGGDTGGGDGY